jgi:hypothetical protein
VTLYEVLDGLPEDERVYKLAIKARFLEARSFFQKGDFEAALQIFTTLLGQQQADILVGLYIRRCSERVNQEPDPTWDGVVRLNEK